MDSAKNLGLLRITLPDGGEQVAPIDKSPFNLGRVPGNDLILAHQQVSRQHARVLVEGDHFQLIDLKSTNGTFVGETRLTPNEPFRLGPGESFRIGPYTIRVEAAPAPPPPAKPEPVEAPKRVEPSPAPEAEPARPMPAPEPEPLKSPPIAQPPVAANIKVGTADLPVRPIAPTAKSQPDGDHQIPYDMAFGLPKDVSRYLRHLPPLYQDKAFLGRFLLAFEGIWAPLEQTVDHFDLYLDPLTTPAFFLDDLARWLDLTLDEKWDLAKRRELVAEAAELYRRRGTRWSLSRHLEIYTGIAPEISEPADRPHHFHVTLRLPPDPAIDRATVDRIIRANQPAHTTYTLEIITAPAG